MKKTLPQSATATTATAAGDLVVYGLNLGYSSVKAVMLRRYTDDDGVHVHEARAIFPSLVAPAAAAATPDGAGADLGQALVVEVDGKSYWTGRDATMAREEQAVLGRQRLFDLAFLPALTAATLARLGATTPGLAVTGLPAAWATERDLAVALGARLRAGAPADFFTGLRAIAEPQGGIYGLLLNSSGEIAHTGYGGRILVVDWGHFTVDCAIIDSLTVIKSSLQSLQRGTAAPLQRIKAQISAKHGRDLSLYHVDEAVRAGLVRIAGQDLPLPAGWDRPVIDNARATARAIADAYNDALDCDFVVMVGGGAEEERNIKALQDVFPHLVVPKDPQLCIAEGYAYWAMRLALGLA